MSFCLVRAAVPAKRVWLGLSARLGLRRTTGLGELRKEVRTCEYHDVHVMWELLGGMDGGAPPHVPSGMAAATGEKQTTRRRTRKAGAGAAAWSRLFSSCCAF